MKKRGPKPIEPSRRIVLMLGQKSDREVAAVAGVSILTVLKWRGQRGIPSHRAARKVEVEWVHPENGATYRGADAVQAIFAYHRGYGLRAGAKVLGIAYKTLQDWSHRLGLKWHRGGVPENKTTLRRKMIRTLSKQGFSLREIGEALGVSGARVHQLLQNDQKKITG